MTDKADANGAQQDATALHQSMLDLVEGVNEAVFSMTPQGVFTYISPVVEQELGWAPHEVVGRSFRELIDEADVERVAAEVGRMANGERRTFEHRMRQRDGEVAWIRTAGRPVRYDGEVVAIHGIAFSNSEVRKALEAARNSELRLLRLIDSMPVMVDAMDDNGVCIYWNREAEKVTGYSAGEIVGDPDAHRRFYPDQEEYDRVLAERAQRGGRFRDWEVSMVCKDGSRKIIAWSDISDEVTIPGWHRWGIGIDVTARVQALDHLRESEHRYRLLVDSLAETIATVDREGRFHFMNKIAADSLGGEPKDFVGKTMFELFPREHAERQAASVRAVIDSGKSRVIEAPTVVRGEMRIYQTLIQPMDEASGQHGRAIVLARDVTAFKQVEEGLRQAHRQLMEADERERQALARDLHDSLGQDLFAVQLLAKGLAESAAKEGEVGRRYADDLNMLHQRIGQVHDEVRRLCRGLYPSTLDTLGLVPALRQMTNELADESGVVIELHDHIGEQRFRDGMEIALFRIAQESVSNALKHAEASRVIIRLSMDDGHVELCVCDDGQGFDRDQPSSGMGLVSMRERAGGLGGTCEVTARPKGSGNFDSDGNGNDGEACGNQVGTRVCVRIPVKAPPPPHQRPPRSMK